RYGLPLLVPSFGATAVLVYGAVNSPFAQPRNVVGGHLVSAATGVLVYQLIGSGWLSLTLAVSLAILFMLLTRTVHPPGGATAFVAVWNGQGYLFILTPVLVGAVVLVLIALFVNNFGRSRCYPTYWL
ncbi:MAG: HPP family protein, partial [Desulfotomaculales bacterium]